MLRKLIRLPLGQKLEDKHWIYEVIADDIELVGAAFFKHPVIRSSVTVMYLMKCDGVNISFELKIKLAKLKLRHPLFELSKRCSHFLAPFWLGNVLEMGKKTQSGQ